MARFAARRKENPVRHAGHAWWDVEAAAGDLEAVPPEVRSLHVELGGPVRYRMLDPQLCAGQSIGHNGWLKLPFMDEVLWPSLWDFCCGTDAAPARDGHLRSKL